MTLAMSQEIDFLVMQRVFRRFVSQPAKGYPDEATISTI
jgi:hypothetical protein